MYPRVTVNLGKIEHNARHMVSLCAQYGISVLGVTKVIRGELPIARAMVSGGIKMLGDSRIMNIKKYSGLNCEKWLIRMPGISEASDCVKYCDVSLNSELTTLRALNDAAVSQGKIHKVIIMADLGDLREGCFTPPEDVPGSAAAPGERELYECCAFAQNAPGLELYGLGTNLTCFSFVQPTTEKLKRLVSLAGEASEPSGAGHVARSKAEKPGAVGAERKGGAVSTAEGGGYGAVASRRGVTGEAGGGKLRFLSGGNSATLKLMLSGGIPEGVNTLRLGESVLFGRERADFTYLPGMYNDAFKIEAEVIERKLKPTKPVGIIGKNSYGETPVFEDRGERIRAICALGRQDADAETMWPEDEGIEIIGASSDHFVIDITDAREDIQVGDTVSFRLGYFSAMRAFTSDYVEKVYIS